MRILITRSNPISPDSRVEKEAESLTHLGHRVIILGWDRSSRYPEKKDILKNAYGSADIYRFGIPGAFGAGINNLKALREFQKETYNWMLQHRDEFDAIHACDFDNGIVAKKAAKRLNKLFVYDVFDYYAACHKIPFNLNGIVARAENNVISSADATIICSEQRVEQIQGSNPKKLFIIHNAPHMGLLNAASEKFKLQADGTPRIKIGYVGILSRARLLEEIVEFVSGRPDVELHIGGFGQLESFMREKADQFSNIFFYGKLPYSDALALEMQMDILTAIYDPSVPNHYYAAPNKFYEALMLGKPLIMIKNTGMDKTVKDNKLGEVIEFSKEGFEIGVDKLISYRDKWNEIAEREKTIFNSDYSWEIMEKRLGELYSELESSTKRMVDFNRK